MLPASDDDDVGHRKRRKWWVGVALVVVAMCVGWVMAGQVRSPEQAASEAAPPQPSWITARVERRVLAQTVISRGDVGPQVSIAVGVPSTVEGTPVITAITSGVGDQVVEGSRVIEVSGRPVFVLQGAVPVYRSLKPGMIGADVSQLHAALTRLGCDTTVDGDMYALATKLCVAKLYIDAGYDTIAASPTEQADRAVAQQSLADSQAAIDSAQLAFDSARKGPTATEILAADTALHAAQRGYNDAVAQTNVAVAQAKADLAAAQTRLNQLRGTVDATAADIDAAQNDVDHASVAVDQATRAGIAAMSSANDAVVLASAARNDLNAPPDVTEEYTALGRALAARDRAQSALDEFEAANGPTVAQGEVVFAPTLPARVQQAVTRLGPLDSSQTAGGEPSATSPSQLVTLASGDLVLTMTLRVGDRGLVRPGMGVELLDEQSNASYSATIATIADEQAVGGDGQPGYPTVVTAGRPLPDTLTGANLRVTITAASTPTATLVVPIAAVSSSADGATNVSIIPDGTPADSDPVVVAVAAGLSADGFVSVAPIVAGSLNEGDRVVVGR